MDSSQDLDTADGPAPRSKTPRVGDKTAEFGLQVSGLQKAFGNSVLVVNDLDLDLVKGTFTSLLGESGCGKTTTLRMVAGLERPDAGEVRISGTKVFSTKEKINIVPNKRRIGFVFQSYALWPHMSVIDNVAYPLRRARMRKLEARARALETLAMLQCGQLAGRFPGELSGGQQQRVALGRVLADRTNEVVLFDEPLSNLDAKLRDELRFEIRALQDELGFTALYVTHDQAEAMAMSDRVVVMRLGRIERDGSPREVFDRPRTRYVTDFLGRHNVLRAHPVAQRTEQPEAQTALGRVRVIADGTSALGDDYAVAIRVESVHVSTDKTPASTAAGTVTGVAYYGDHQEIRLELPSGEKVRARAEPEQEIHRGQQLHLHVSGSAVRVGSLEE